MTVKSRAVIDPGGRLSVPQDLRKIAGIVAQDVVELEWVDGAIRIRTMEQVLASARKLFAPSVVEDIDGQAK